MKILIISHMYPNQARPAMGVFVREQAKYLVQHADITIVSPVPYLPIDIKGTSYVGFKDIPLIDHESHKGKTWKIIRPKYFTGPLALGRQLDPITLYLSIRLNLKELDDDYDVIHSHTPLPDGYSALKLSKKWNIPYVTTWHGFYEYHHHKFTKKMMEKVIHHSQSVTYDGTSLKRSISNYQCDFSKFQMMGYGSSKPNEAVPDLSSSVKEFIGQREMLLVVGFLIERKGHIYVLKALKELIKKGHPNICCILIGEGAEKAKLESYIEENDLTNHVLLVGNVEHQHLWSYYQACSIFVLPSWDEAFGVVYVEALSQKRLVIGCQNEGPQDIIQNKKNGFLVPPRDEKALVEVISPLLANPKKKKEMEDTIDPSQYTWDKVGEKLMAILRKAIHP